MVNYHHLQLRYFPLLFHNFTWFNIKTTTTHHTIIQKEVDDLLVKGGIEPLTGDAGFYSNVFVIPKCNGDLQPILNLK